MKSRHIDHADRGGSGTGGEAWLTAGGYRRGQATTPDASMTPARKWLAGANRNARSFEEVYSAYFASPGASYVGLAFVTPTLWT